MIASHPAVLQGASRKYVTHKGRGDGLESGTVFDVIEGDLPN